MAVQANTEPKTGFDVKMFIHVMITVFFMFFFRFIPAPEPITPFGMAIVGIFFGLI